MSGIGDLAPWRGVAPAVFGRFDAIEQRAQTSIDSGLLVPVRVAIASILGPEGAADLVVPSDAAAPADEVTACVAFAEQFVVDVATTTDEQRAAMSAAMGSDAFTFVQVLYVSDVFLRARIALGRLFETPYPSTASLATPAIPVEDLWPMLERFMAEVAQLDALDPLTAELVRLHGARAHNCRLCQSRLSVRALDAAGDAAVFAAPIDDLRERDQVALRLTDALITQPSMIDAGMVAAVRERFTTEEIVEIVLDVARNAANKIAVAFGADAAVVTEGVEYYDIDATGEVVADVDIDAVRRATAR